MGALSVKLVAHTAIFTRAVNAAYRNSTLPATNRHLTLDVAPVQATNNFKTTNESTTETTETLVYLLFVQVLPDEVAADGAPTGGRYDHVVRLFGEKFVKEKIMNAKTFMVSWCCRC